MFLKVFLKKLFFSPLDTFQEKVSSSSLELVCEKTGAHLTETRVSSS